MVEYRTRKLADVCKSIDYGFTAPARTAPVGPKFLRITDIVGPALDWPSVPYVEGDSESLERCRLHHGDIVIARTGATTGESYFIEDPPDAVFASYLVRLKISDDTDPRYVAYWLKSPEFRNYLAGVLGDKSAQPNASATTLTNAPMRLPSSETYQGVVASVLAALDDKIEANRRMNKTLEAMGRAIFEDWFVDFGPTYAKTERGRAPYLAADIWKHFPKALDDDDKPQGWTTMRLADIAEQCKGSVSPSIRPKQRYEHFSLPAYDNGQRPSGDFGDTIKSNKIPVPRGTVLLSKLNPEIPRVWIPNEPSENPQIASTEFLVFRPKPPAGRGFLYYLFCSAPFRRRLEGMVTGTSKSHQRISPSALLQAEVIAASPDIIKAFEHLIAPTLTQLLQNRAESLTLARMRDLLLPKLMSGEVRVTAGTAVEAVL
jgi:type I restriction enzyme S subunit